MESYKFCLPSIKIKSNWFEGKHNIFKEIGKDEGLNLYLQLFRFRVHQGNYNTHLFHTSLLLLQKFTNINKSKRLQINNIKELLIKMENAGVIKLRSYDIENMNGNELIIIEATDTPYTTRNNGQDKNIGDENKYIYVNFKTIDYMYNQLKLTSKEVSMYILFSKYGLGKGERKITMKINRIREVLGTRNDTVTDMLIKFNESGLAYTRILKDGYKVKFEHYICRNVGDIEEFKRETKYQREKFLKRYE